MASAMQPELERPALPSRREILEWYESLPRRGHHQILGVTARADRDELRSAFASLARCFHPDALAAEHGELAAEIQAIFTRIIEAYQSLAAVAPAPGEDPTQRRRPADPAPPRAAPRRAAASPDEQVPVQRPAFVPSNIRREPTSEEKRERIDEALRDAEASSAGGDTETAVTRLHQVLPLADRRQHRRVRLSLARAYQADERWRRYGVDLLEDIVREEPGDAEALALLGAALLREGLLARAEGLLARAVVADPRNARARSDLRELRAELQRRRAAVPRKAERRGFVGRLLSIAR